MAIFYFRRGMFFGNFLFFAFVFFLAGFGIWFLAFGFWLLAFGFWLLSFGIWLLPFGFCGFWLSYILHSCSSLFAWIGCIFYIIFKHVVHQFLYLCIDIMQFYMNMFFALILFMFYKSFPHACMDLFISVLDFSISFLHLFMFCFYICMDFFIF